MTDLEKFPGTHDWIPAVSMFGCGHRSARLTASARPAESTIQAKLPTSSDGDAATAVPAATAGGKGTTLLFSSTKEAVVKATSRASALPGSRIPGEVASGACFGFVGSPTGRQRN